MADEQKKPEEETLTDDVQETTEEIVEDVQETVEEVKTTVETEAQATAHAIVHAESEHHAEHHYTDEVVLPYFGSIGTMPGGIYTFVFLVLGALTLIEVLITIIFPENVITISMLVLLSLGKAYLVVMYYMHLNRDNPIFRLVLLLPLLVVLLSTLYLLGVPTGAGLGYN